MYLRLADQSLLVYEWESSAQVDSKCTQRGLSQESDHSPAGFTIRLVHSGYTWSPLARLSAMNQLPVSALGYS